MKHQDVIERANKQVKELIDALDVFPANYSAYHNKVESVLLDLNYWWGKELDRQREEIANDMRLKLKDWSGSGPAMVDDYFNSTKDHERD